MLPQRAARLTEITINDLPYLDPILSVDLLDRNME
jgi:hypothetical protein